MQYHNPVLLKECIEGLKIDPAGIYVDVTFGGGGHSREILKHLTTGKLYAFDQDADAEGNVMDDERFVLVKQNFRYMKNYLRMYGALPVDGILADLGISSHQIDVPERGFSTRFEGPLDMRMNQAQGTTAADVLNNYEEDKLRRILGEYGEVENAGRLSRAIAAARLEKPLETIEELKKLLAGFARRGKENQYYAQVFQALRIEVNNELGVLKEMLMQTPEVLKEGGRLVVISYHSLEDRLVKNFMRSGKFEGEAEKDLYGNLLTPLRPVNRKPVLPSEEEIKSNSRARSAKLRIAEKV
jgi:16S rRNA (cytosine1402-N4)-methyltransferase